MGRLRHKVDGPNETPMIHNVRGAGFILRADRKFRTAPATADCRRHQNIGRRNPMRQPQFIRSNTFHWASVVAGVFAVFIIVLFGFIYWQIDDYLTARSDRMITDPDRRHCRALPPTALARGHRGRICGRIPAACNLPRYLAPTVTGSPAISRACRPALRSTRRRKACEIVKTDQTGADDQVVRAIARRMQNGDVLVIGRNVDETREISHVVGQALALGLLPASVFACWRARG